MTALFEKQCGKDEIRKCENKWVEILDANLNTISPFLENNEKNNERVVRTQKRNVDEKKYFCSFCEKAFQSNWHLNQHQDTLKHQFTYLNSLD